MFKQTVLFVSSLSLATPALAALPDFYCATMETAGDTLKTNPAFTVARPKSPADLSSYAIYYHNGTFGFDSGGDGYTYKVDLLTEDGQTYVIGVRKDKKLHWTLTPRDGNRLHVVGYLFPDHDDAMQGKKDAHGYTISIPDGVACTGLSPHQTPIVATANRLPSPPVSSSALRDVIAGAFFTDPQEVARLRTKIEIREVDLNGDGRNEVIASVDDTGWCGSAGCQYEVFVMDGDKPKSIGGFLGFGLSPGTKTSGQWLPLTLDSRAGPKRLVYKDGKYR